MKKKLLRICNFSLLLVSPVTLASGILLESLHGTSCFGIEAGVWTVLHIILALSLTAFVLWHLALNWQGVRQWPGRFRRHRFRRFRLAVVLFLLTAVTGILAVPLWSSCGHGGFGGWHGKLGFAAAFFVLLHIVQHRHWYSVKPGWR